MRKWRARRDTPSTRRLMRIRRCLSGRLRIGVRARPPVRRAQENSPPVPCASASDSDSPDAAVSVRLGLASFAGRRGRNGDEMHATPNDALACGCKYRIRASIRYQLPYQLRRNDHVRYVWDRAWRTCHAPRVRKTAGKVRQICHLVGILLVAAVLLVLLTGALALML